jgi:hypothetical protein
MKLDQSWKACRQKRQDKETNVNFSAKIPCPEIPANYDQEMGSVERHNYNLLSGTKDKTLANKNSTRNFDSDLG